jgi:hypothetical protein
VPDVPAPDPRDFLPHPLVVALAQGLGPPGSTLKERGDAVGEARRGEAKNDAPKKRGDKAVPAGRNPDNPAANPDDGDDQTKAPRNTVQRAANALARELHVDEVVMFVGYLGGSTADGDAEDPPEDPADWLVFYLDPRLQTWLLVQRESIVARRTVKDELSPFGSHDVIWVRQQAPVRHGSGPQSVEQRFLTGSFTRAGDFDAPPAGGTFAPQPGVLGVGGSPVCCYYRTRPRP